MRIEHARRRLRLRDLEMLQVIVRTGSMRKAAELLHLSQPAVSKAIAELEALLELPLLERGPGGIRPTPFGASLLQRSVEVLAGVDGALRELEALADPDGGEVRFGCMETLHAGLVGEAIQQVLRRSPRMRILSETGQSPALIAHFLAGGLVDFIVARPATLPLPPDVVGEPLFHDRLLLVVGPSNPLARRRKVRLDDVSGAQWVISINELLPDGPVGRAFAREGVPFPPERRLVSGSLHTRYAMLAAGDAVTLVPHSLLPFGSHRRMFRILPIALPPWETPTMILTMRGRTLGPAVQRFLETVRVLSRPLVLDAAGDWAGAGTRHRTRARTRTGG